MLHYYGIVHKDEDSAFGVSFPDLPGCFSAADDEADLISNAGEAIALYLDDVDNAPTPADYQHIRQLAADDLAEGAFLIRVPYIRDAGKTVRVNITLDQGMLDAIDEEAGRRKVSRSAFLSAAARHLIEA